LQTIVVTGLNLTGGSQLEQFGSLLDFGLEDWGLNPGGPNMCTVLVTNTEKKFFANYGVEKITTYWIKFYGVVYFLGLI
jgi:hypothetical protein